MDTVIKFSYYTGCLCRTAFKHYKMELSFREGRQWSLVSLWTNVTDKEKLALLYDMNSDKFDVESLCDNERKTEFRFDKYDIFEFIWL